MPWRVASWPVVGIVLAGTPAALRSLMTAPARPSLASTVALMFGLAVYACWKIAPPFALSQPGAICSPTSVMPLLVAPLATWGTFWPQMASL